MLKPYSPTVDIWSLTDDEIRSLQPGQWVTAGPNGGRGRFFGYGASIVVAWQSRLPKGRHYREFLKRYAAYGKAVRCAGVPA